MPGLFLCVAILSIRPSSPHRHSGAGRNPVASVSGFREAEQQSMAGQRDNQTYRYWIPACAGMTVRGMAGEARF
jgi:hypothetical protein